jgi:prolyl-tRNA editing enzyme YbaK/EbsC (Cys-tRNA(Pro) deacylase)
MQTNEARIGFRGMWPPEVEQIAAPLRAAGVEARLEQLPAGHDTFPGAGARAFAYDCDGRQIVVLVEADAEPDPAKVALAAGCRDARRAPPPPFPYTGAARVLLEQRLLTTDTVWVEAGSPRHFLGLNPTVLAEVTRAAAADLSREG